MGSRETVQGHQTFTQLLRQSGEDLLWHCWVTFFFLQLCGLGSEPFPHLATVPCHRCCSSRYRHRHCRPLPGLLEPCVVGYLHFLAVMSFAWPCSNSHEYEKGPELLQQHQDAQTLLLTDPRWSLVCAPGSSALWCWGLGTQVSPDMLLLASTAQQAKANWKPAKHTQIFPPCPTGRGRSHQPGRTAFPAPSHPTCFRWQSQQRWHRRYHHLRAALLVLPW